jgi:hypothetical protein
VSQLRDRARALIVCTIYNGYFPDALTRRLTATALTVFNDAILRVAIERALTTIDLRVICTDATDYVGHIEPSREGGGKIASAITRAVLGSDSTPRATIIGR